MSSTPPEEGKKIVRPDGRERRRFRTRAEDVRGRARQITAQNENRSDGLRGERRHQEPPGRAVKVFEDESSGDGPVSPKLLPVNVVTWNDDDVLGSAAGRQRGREESLDASSEDNGTKQRGDNDPEDKDDEDQDEDEDEDEDEDDVSQRRQAPRYPQPRGGDLDRVLGLFSRLGIGKPPVRPRFGLYPPQYAFSHRDIHQESAAEVFACQISNTVNDGSAITVSSITVEGRDAEAGVFTLTNVLEADLTLDPGAQHHVGVSFNPTAAGRHHAVLRVKLASGEESSAELSGHGVAARADYAPGLWSWQGDFGFEPYAEDVNAMIESAFAAGHPDATVLLRGSEYTIDFGRMQQRNRQSARSRRVERLLAADADKWMSRLRCMPAAYVGEDHKMDCGDRILLPVTALAEITDHAHRQLRSALSLRISAPGGRSVTCGAMGWNAPEGTLVLPRWLMEALDVEHGFEVTVERTALPAARHVTLQPLADGLPLADTEAVRSALELVLSRNYTTLTKGVTIPIRYGASEYPFVVVDVAPLDDDARGSVNIVGAELSLELLPPEESSSPDLRTRVLHRDPVAGPVSVDDVVEGGFYRYYSVLPPPTASPGAVGGIIIEGASTEGDADIFVSSDTHRPTQVEHSYAGFEPGNKRVTIPAEACQRPLFVGVFGHKGRAAFRLTIRDGDCSAAPETGVSLPSAPPTPHGADCEDKAGKRECATCRQWVPDASIDRHEAFCSRNNHVCEECRAVVRHTEEHWHCPVCSVVASATSHTHCETCGEAVNTDKMLKHVEYYHTPVRCPCGQRLSGISDVAEHRSRDCGQRVVHCPYCDTGVILAERDAHITFCQGELVTAPRNDEPEPFTCEICRAAFHDFDTLSVHFITTHADGGIGGADDGDFEGVDMPFDTPWGALGVQPITVPVADDDGDDGIFGGDPIEWQRARADRIAVSQGRNRDHEVAVMFGDAEAGTDRDVARFLNIDEI